MANVAGDPQDHQPGDGAEDEHHDQQQTQHAARGAVTEPPPASQHSQVEYQKQSRPFMVIL